ncbi:MAG: hypothetical protein KIT73_18195, partial [Burkholderiales bacterium]|nr:hypothetical protein [Burkholderiales bacterium]
MNKLFKSLVLAGAIAGSGAAANAATLVYDFAGSVDLTIPAEYADLYAIWNESPAYATFRGTIILPAFENYLTGTHEIALNTAGLQLSIVSGLLGEIEGTRANVTAPNPAFDPSLPTCTSGRGCDLDGDGVR